MPNQRFPFCGRPAPRAERGGAPGYGSALVACDAGAQWAAAVALLGGMAAARAPPDAPALHAAAGACAKSGVRAAASALLAAARTAAAGDPER